MDIYRQEILDHFRNPHNEGILDEYDIKHEENNPLCGDTITLYLKTKDGKLDKISFLASGCAISKAAASMLSDEIKAKTKEEICRMNLNDIKDLMGIPLSSSREKCGMLALNGIKGALGC